MHHAEAATVVEVDGGVEAPLRWNSTRERSPSMPGNIEARRRRVAMSFEQLPF